MFYYVAGFKETDSIRLYNSRETAEELVKAATYHMADDGRDRLLFGFGDTKVFLAGVYDLKAEQIQLVNVLLTGQYGHQTATPGAVVFAFPVRPHVAARKRNSIKCESIAFKIEQVRRATSAGVKRGLGDLRSDRGVKWVFQV